MRDCLGCKAIKLSRLTPAREAISESSRSLQHSQVTSSIEQRPTTLVCTWTFVAKKITSTKP